MIVILTHVHTIAVFFHVTAAGSCSDGRRANSGTWWPWYVWYGHTDWQVGSVHCLCWCRTELLSTHHAGCRNKQRGTGSAIQPYCFIRTLPAQIRRTLWELNVYLRNSHLQGDHSPWKRGTWGIARWSGRSRGKWSASDYAWKRPAGCPRSKWPDQISSDNDLPPADLDPSLSCTCLDIIVCMSVFWSRQCFQRWQNQSRCHLREADLCWPKEPCIRWGYIWVPPGIYDWTIHDWLWCRLSLWLLQRLRLMLYVGSLLVLIFYSAKLRRLNWQPNLRLMRICSGPSEYWMCDLWGSKWSYPYGIDTMLQSLLADPLYTGLRQTRVSGAEYNQFIDEFMEAVVNQYVAFIITACIARMYRFCLVCVCVCVCVCPGGKHW